MASETSAGQIGAEGNFRVGDHSSGIAAFAWKTSGVAPCNSLPVLQAVSSGDPGDPNIRTAKHGCCETLCDLSGREPSAPSAVGRWLSKG